MGQPGGADHEGERDEEHVDAALRAARVGREPEVRHDPVEGHEQPGPAFGHRAAEGDLRDGYARHLEGDEHRRDRVGEDQHAVLGDLRVRDALHAAEHRVEEDDAHADQQPGGDVHAQEAREDDPDAAHLARDVRERDDDEADHRDDARSLGVVALADELGDRVLAELAQVRREEQRQQHVAARPAHQVDRAVVAEERDQSRHRDERRGRHPVRGGRHAVGDRVDVLARDVEVPRALGLRPERDADVEREGGPDDQVGQRGEVHQSSSSTLCLRSSRPIRQA